MRYRIITLLATVLLYSMTHVLAVSPYISTSPPAGQYHPLSELWVNESVINWLGLEFKNLSSVGVQEGFYQGSPLIYPGTYGISMALHSSYSDFLLSLDDGSGRVNLYWNAYFNGTYHKYLTSDAAGASRILINGNIIQFFTAPSGAQESIIYWNNPLTIAGMNVGIGTANPLYLLDVNGDARIQGDLAVNTINKGIPLTSNNINNYALTSIYIKNLSDTQFSITPSAPYISYVPEEGIDIKFDSSTNSLNFCLKIGIGLGFDASGNLINTGVISINDTTGNLYLINGTGISMTKNGSSFVIENTGDTDASDDITDLTGNYPINVSRSGNSATVSLLYNTSAGLDINNNHLYVKISNPIVYDANGALTLKTCPNGYILKYDSSNGWICSPDETATTTGGLYSINIQDPSGNTQFTIDNSSNYIRFGSGTGIILSFDSQYNTITYSLNTSWLSNNAITSLNTLVGDINLQAGTGININTDSGTNTITITNTLPETYKVKINSYDTSPDYLENKIVGGAGINVSSSNDTISIALKYPSESCSSGQALQGIDLDTGTLTCVSVDTNPSDDITYISVQNSTGSTQFTINSNSNYIRFEAGEGVTINFNSTTNTVSISDSNAASEITGFGGYPYLAYFKDSHQISYAKILYYDGVNYRLGINTDTPSATLDVQGTVNAGNDKGKILIKDTGDIEILI